MHALTIFLLCVLLARAAKPEEGVTLTPAAVYFIAASFVDFLKQKGLQNVKVGQAYNAVQLLGQHAGAMLS
jgi:hypothetical protein